MIGMLNAGVHPVMFQHGSVGACGDLSPMSQFALVLMGEWEAFYKGERMPATQALEKAGLKPEALQARDGLAAIPGVDLYCQEGLTNHIAVLALNVEGMDPGDVGTMLDVDHNIACRTGLHCAPLVHEQLGNPRGAVRFGLGPFNTEEHIQAAIEAVSETAAFAKR